MKIFLGISGASGVNLGLKLACEIAKRSELHLCVSKNAMNVLEKELNFTDIFYKNGVAAKFEKNHGDKNAADVNFKISAQNLTSCDKNDSQSRRDEDEKSVNFSSAQGELDFGGGDERSKNQSDKISDKAQDLGGNVLNFDALENYALSDANVQICKFDGGEKNERQDAQISGKFGGSKFQNKSEFDKNCTQKDEIYQIWQDLQNRTAIHDDSDLAAAPSSGSFGIDATIVAPCSISTLAKIHAGFADTLITRAAAVALKERKRLVLGVREMPFSTLALEHAAKLSALGAVIAPPVFGYYSGQNSLEDMENFIIGKWLDLLGLEHQIYKRWG
ncbi:3-octaprenyl-4-hydroxybenzoate carboxy-lyase [Campylobacter showae]|uniref:Polyprenyl P-hydroxybenzoate and phenylacrylic acid decarboxylase n=2 Tax=Campylobacter showae TaxID=204 RepID=C6RF23_9BACT|nr:UbiX family flavin prenyltransferase [Campylobacter showae]EET79831.1 polyprenyl P-hydroxybenzoate and phenylacrylic acid decarboxylase [Campylobacter showae RM3277]QCD48945.1 3-octaprenyl-4-hydroxybenzoate carboxy-lyase [Campylobacter showae]